MNLYVDKYAFIYYLCSYIYIIMNHELKRNLLIKYYTKNIGGVFFLTFASILLTYLWKPSANMYNYFLGLFTMLFATFITWVGHWSMHNYNKYNLRIQT